MRKIWILLAGLVMATTVLTPPATAITGDFVEDDEHPFVGLVALYDESGEYLQRCSGSLLTPTVFLTAGHCTAEETGAFSARVYFQQDPAANFNPETGTDPDTGYPEFCGTGTEGVTCAAAGTIHNYGWSPTRPRPDTGDVGLVILDQPIALAEYGQLAAVGTLDALATQGGQQDRTVTASGYGLTEVNPVRFTSFRRRLMAQARLTNLRSHLTDGFNLQTNGNGRGRGGTCSGDSGGPMLLGGFDSNVIVAVTSFGLNPYCRGVDFSFRTDQQDVQDWIRGTIGDGEWPKVQVVTP